MGVILNYSMVGLGGNIVLRPAFVTVLSGRLWLYYGVNVNASKFLCDAYTIHIFIRSARHGHKLSGKLKRIAQQEDQKWVSRFTEYIRLCLNSKQHQFRDHSEFDV